MAMFPRKKNSDNIFINPALYYETVCMSKLFRQNDKVKSDH